jgi:hypothetical protein
LLLALDLIMTTWTELPRTYVSLGIRMRLQYWRSVCHDLNVRGSGELGEILATELVEEMMDYEVPVRRLRYKDGREMALRGDDFIGIRVNAAGNLHLLKGESKSRAGPELVAGR